MTERMENISPQYDVVLWALAVWREARGESYAAKVAVAYCIQNRALDPRWPNTPAEVVLQPYQFSSFNDGDPNATKFPAPKGAAWLDCCQAVHDVLAGMVSDPTAGANHYHSLPKSKPWPAWAEANRQTAVIGPFRFYKR